MLIHLRVDLFVYSFFEVFSSYQLELCQDFQDTCDGSIVQKDAVLTRTVNVMNMRSFAIIDIVLRFFSLC